MARIIIVDDEPLIREMLEEVLTGAGYEVTCAADGRKAAKLMQEVFYDLIITDILMPEKDGLGTIEAVRKSHPNTKIIAISGGSPIRETDLLGWAKELGADYAFQKPVACDELLAAVDDCLR